MMLAIDGIVIGEERIREEMQYHPAASPDAAREAAANALIVRTVLLTRARRSGLTASAPQNDSSSKLVEAPEEALIRTLIEREVQPRDVSEADCRTFYDAHPDKFRSPDLLQAAHILFAAKSDDETAMAAAKEKAQAALARLKEKPALFGNLAQELSDCTSRENGGDLGQVTRGSTVPELETFLFALEPGQICPVPIRSRYGWHIARLDRRLNGRLLPFEAVRGRIARFLAERNWQEAVSAYIGGLVAGARIERSADYESTTTIAKASCGSGCGCANAGAGRT